MINSFRLANGLRTYFNIGAARLNGAEFQVQKNVSWLKANVSYTHLDHRNISDNRPLDVLSRHNLSFELDFLLPARLRLGVAGAGAPGPPSIAFSPRGRYIGFSPHERNRPG